MGLIIIGSFIIGAIVSLVLIVAAIVASLRLRKRASLLHWVLQALISLTTLYLFIQSSWAHWPKGDHEGPPTGEDFTDVMTTLFLLALSPGLSSILGLIAHMLPGKGPTPSN